MAREPSVGLRPGVAAVGALGIASALLQEAASGHRVTPVPVPEDASPGCGRLTVLRGASLQLSPPSALLATTPASIETLHLALGVRVGRDPLGSSAVIVQMSAKAADAPVSNFRVLAIEVPLSALIGQSRYVRSID